MNFLTVLWGETVKLRRIKLTWITLVIMVGAALALNGFLWIVRNPGMAGSLGLIGQKANLAFGGQTPDWALLAATLTEMAGLGGMLLSSFILAWLFGREYLQGTAKNLLVLPLPRAWFVLAKVLVALLWSFLLQVALWVVAGLVGTGQGLQGFDPVAFKAGMPAILAVWLGGFAVALPVAWVAVASRGVFVPLGYAIGTMLCASMFGNLGWGPYVPWSIIGIASGAGGAGIGLNAISWVIVAATAALGLGLAIHHLETADNTQ